MFKGVKQLAPVKPWDNPKRTEGTPSPVMRVSELSNLLTENGTVVQQHGVVESA